MKQVKEWVRVEVDTVGQLQEALKAFPPDAQIDFFDGGIEVATYRPETPAEREARLIEDKRYRERRKEMAEEFKALVAWFEYKEDEAEG